jgi:hypothetical protein
MCAAAAEMPVEGGDDVAAAGRGIAVEQRLGRHDDAAQAIATLPRLLIEEGLLQGMRPGRRAQAFDGGDLAFGHRADFARAGVDGLAVDQHHAAAALLQPAAVARAHQAEVIAQDVEQGRRLRSVDALGLAVDCEGNGHPVLPLPLDAPLLLAGRGT